MKGKLNKISDILSWVALAGVCVLLVYVLVSTVNAKKTGEENFILGYRPMVILTGSMEPYMMTNSVALSKEVHEIDDIAVGDVITFHLENELGETIRITHRVTNITEDGFVNTKGDNNNSDDGLELTMENIDGKVVWVCNATATLVAQWQTTTGKIIILSFLAAIFLFYFSVKSFFQSKRAEHEITMELVVTYNEYAEQLGKTPRQMFIEDTERHRLEIEELLNPPVIEDPKEIYEDPLAGQDWRVTEEDIRQGQKHPDL